jgi:hypothetical protein
MAFAQFLNPVRGHPTARGEQAAERDGRGGRIPLQPRSPVLVPVRERRIVAVHHKPPAGPQCAVRAKRQPAAEPVEHDVDAIPGELSHALQEVLVLIVDCDRAEPLHRASVARGAGPVSRNSATGPSSRTAVPTLPAAP